MRWPLTFYTDRFIPKGSAGFETMGLIFIRPKYRDDYGLYRHELEHVKQTFRGLFFFDQFGYLLSKRYRLWSEVQAYHEQAKHYPDDRMPLFARFIADDYGLSITQEAALQLLRR